MRYAKCCLITTGWRDALRDGSRPPKEPGSRHVLIHVNRMPHFRPLAIATSTMQRPNVCFFVENHVPDGKSACDKCSASCHAKQAASVYRYGPCPHACVWIHGFDVAQRVTREGVVCYDRRLQYSPLLARCVCWDALSGATCMIHGHAIQCSTPTVACGVTLCTVRNALVKRIPVDCVPHAISAPLPLASCRHHASWVHQKLR